MLAYPAFSEIKDFPIDPSHCVAIVGVAAQNRHISSYDCKMLAFCTLLARRLILFKWRDPLPHTFLHWIKEIM